MPSRSHPGVVPAIRALARGGRLAAGSLALLALASCTDDPTASDSAPLPPASGSHAEGAAADSVIIEPEAFSRFSTSVTAAGAFRPGVPVQIRVRTTAHLNSPETRLRVVVPELDAPVPQDQPTDRKGPPPAKRSRDRWTASIDAGATNTHVTSIVFPRPGVYHVAVEASHAPDPTVTAQGRPVQHVVGEMVQVEVSERGVRVAPARGPANMQPGIMVCLPEDPYCEKEEPEPPPPSPVVWVWTAVWYSGPEMSTYEPIRRARVNYSGYGVPTGQTTTDEGGYALLPCNPSNGLTNVTVTLSGAEIRMTATHTSVSTTIDMRPSCYGGGWVAWYNWSEGRTWDNMLKTIDASRSHFGFARGQVRARVGGVASCGSSSCYLRGTDEILIHPDNVWGTWGDFTAGHEYGHAVQAHTSAGMRSCGGSHSWNDTRQDRCLALNEGFASYVAFASRGAGLDPYYSQHARDDWAYHCPGTSSCETRVTAFLMDVSEANVDPYGYGIQLPPRHVFDMIGGCWLYFSTYDYEYQYTTSSWSQGQRNDLGEVWDCLEKQYPQFRGTMRDANGRYVDIMLDRISHGWAPLDEPVRSAVAGRFSR